MHTKNNKIKSQHGFNHAPSTSGALRLLKSANDFITGDIHVMKTDKFSNIDPAGISSMEKHIKSVLESLQIVLRTLLSKNACVGKTTAVGQTIIQTARPGTVIAPLLLGLDLMLHHHYCSWFTIDSLNSMAFAVHTLRFRDLRQIPLSPRIQIFRVAFSGGWVILQYMADNIDHNKSTLDEKNAFHGIEIIFITNPGTKRTAQIPCL